MRTISPIGAHVAPYGYMDKSGRINKATAILTKQDTPSYTPAKNHDSVATNIAGPPTMIRINSA